MKQIIAIIQPQRLTRIRELARREQFPGMTIDKVEGFSTPQEAATGTIKSELTEYSPKVRLVIVAPDERAQPIAESIRAACHTGERGDGLVWITPIDWIARIRDDRESR